MKSWILQCNSVQNVSKSDTYLQPHFSHGNGLPDHRLACMLDFAGPIQGKVFSILIAHSKWIEVYPMSSTTATGTVERLRSAYICIRMLETLVSDNGSQFTAEEFHSFYQNNAIQYVQVAPYKFLIIAFAGTLSERQTKWLFSYRITRLLQEKLQWNCCLGGN